MKLKMTALVAALAASTSSIAAIAPGSTDNGELFLAVFDSTAQVSYTLDLGVFMNDFFVNAQSTGGYTKNWSVALADGNFTSFLSQTSAANQRWVVFAADNSGGIQQDDKRLFTTVRAGASTDASVLPQNQQFESGIAATKINAFINAVNATGSHSIPGDVLSRSDYTTNGSSVNAATDPGFGYFGKNGGTSATLNGTILNLKLDSAIGDSASFYYMTRSGSNNGLKVLLDQFDNANPDGTQANVGTFTLANTPADGYQLSYSLAAAVPEPSTYALLLAGIGAVGLVARRRKSIV